MFGDVKVKCKNCGRDALASDFVLDPYFRMMVCSKCFKERRGKSIVDSMKAKSPSQLVVTPVQKEVKPKPAGWDEEDEYLEKMAKFKQQTTTQVKKIDDERVSYKCKKCSYEFAYNTIKRTPGRCPYCCAEIDKMRF
ncbi:MAG: hypothetical protein WC471_01235 [Candidatus Woesearchaeota archaeon]